jgi:antitoxin HicB
MPDAYPLQVAVADEGVTITCPDLPGMVTCGATHAEALDRATEAVVTALSIYVAGGRPAPRPSAPHGRPVVWVAALAAAKLALHQAMLATGVSNVELARRLGLDEKAVRRLRDPLHRSHIGAVEAALRHLGRRLELTVREAA